MNPEPTTTEKLPLKKNRSQARQSPSRWLKPLGLFASGLLMLGTASHAQAATLASANLSDVSLGGGVFDYTITLNNIGTTPIQTFWYGWVPGEDFLATSPDAASIVSPTGWSANITNGGSFDGFAIQWIGGSTSDALPAGSSFTFSFQSTDTPAEIAGNSVFYPSTPVGTSFVYEGTPFAGGSDQFVVSSVPVPEPSTFATLGLGLLFLLGWSRRKAPVVS